ncbi:hypothetical protein [Actinophytocola algeriensis]|uniref:DUF4386 family protein n=1 Tax=Actinophytocola algeriensis TaxID=1768010 RepID=A0A7W7VGI6_9PSEU|nr:hypothetical protein [Actinophytocola algeriensis]MBB4909403.1 hypothetical protein [Actinophytocola algeriensis]MBE1475393.1 hypothetical protein [Actinophytocola algeriensis]
MDVQVRVGGYAVIGFAAVIVAANVVAVSAGLPLPGAELAEVRDFFGASDAVGLSSAFTPLAWLLATVFGASAVTALWHAERVWALTGFAGVLLQNATFAALIATRLALTSGGDTATLWALHNGFFALNGTFLATALVGLSVAGVRAGLIRPWHAGLGYVAAALQFASASLAFTVVDGNLGFVGLAGWVLWVVWLVGYGVTLLRRNFPSRVHLAGPRP